MQHLPGLLFNVLCLLAVGDVLARRERSVLVALLEWLAGERR